MTRIVPPLRGGCGVRSNPRGLRPRAIGMPPLRGGWRVRSNRGVCDPGLSGCHPSGEGVGCDPPPGSATPGYRDVTPPGWVWGAIQPIGMPPLRGGSRRRFGVFDYVSSSKTGSWTWSIRRAPISSAMWLANSPRRGSGSIDAAARRAATTLSRCSGCHSTT